MITRLLRLAAAVGALALLAPSSAGARAPTEATEPSAARSPLDAWEDALRGSTTAPADVAFLGTSVSQGFGASSRSHWWVGEVNRQLQAGWGGTSAGYRPASSTFWRDDAAAWSMAGTADDASAGLGLRAQVLDAGTDELQTTITSRSFRLLHAVGPDHGVMEVAVDGRVIAQVDTQAPDRAGGKAWTSQDLGPGPHRVRIRTVAAARAPVARVVVEGILDGDTTTGVRVWDAAHGGSHSRHFVQAPGWQSSMAEADPELVLVELGTNDHASVPPAEFEANLRSIIAAVRSAADGPVSIALVPMYMGEGRDAVRHEPLVEVQRRLAAELGLAVIDLSGLDAGALTIDGLHPDDVGQRVIATAVLETIDPRYHAPRSTPWPMRRPQAGTGAAVAGSGLPASGFLDVPDTSVHSPAVAWAAADGITSGCARALFCPSRPVTRAQFATFLWRLAGEPPAAGSPFSDVSPSAYYAEAVRWVRDRAITTGCTATRFCPTAPATRAQMVTFLWRAAGSPPAQGRHGFADVPPGAYYDDAVVWARDEGITTGTSSTEFSPNDAVTRGQTVLFLFRTQEGSGAAPDPTAVAASHTPATGAVELSWTAPPEPATRYTVIAYDRTADGVATHLTTTSTRATITGLMPGRTYVFGVHAHSAAGVSPGAASNAVTLG